METWELIALGAAGLYVLGKTDLGKSIGSEVGQNVGAGAASTVGNFSWGVVEGVASTIPASTPSGEGSWSVPITGGAMSGTPIQILGAAATNPITAWNLLPFLPDIQQAPVINLPSFDPTQSAIDAAQALIRNTIPFGIGRWF